MYKHRYILTAWRSCNRYWSLIQSIASSPGHVFYCPFYQMSHVFNRMLLKIVQCSDHFIYRLLLFFFYFFLNIKKYWKSPCSFYEYTSVLNLSIGHWAKDLDNDYDHAMIANPYWMSSIDHSAVLLPSHLSINFVDHFFVFLFYKKYPCNFFDKNFTTVSYNFHKNMPRVFKQHQNTNFLKVLKFNFNYFVFFPSENWTNKKFSA